VHRTPAPPPRHGRRIDVGLAADNVPTAGVLVAGQEHSFPAVGGGLDRPVGVGALDDVAVGTIGRRVISRHPALDFQHRAESRWRGHLALPPFSSLRFLTRLSGCRSRWEIERADARKATVAQIAIAWVAAQGVDIVPLVGARRRDRLAEALAAAEVRLTEQDLADIEQAVPAGAAAGDRYAAPAMNELDSER